MANSSSSSDEETIIIAAAACILKERTRKRKRRWWVRRWVGKRNEHGAYHALMEEFAHDDEDSYANFLRMDRHHFEMLLQLITPLISKQDTNMRLSIEAAERLAVTLRFLASGDCYKSMSYLYRIGHSTLGKIIPETCRAIVAVLKERYLKVPSAEDSWKQIALEFEEKWQFPHCIGAIDGKHVAIKAPPNSGSVYFNYKEFHSIILLAVVDAQYRFIWYAVGHNGRQNDAGVFGESSIKKALDQNTLNFPPPSKIRENSQVAVPYVLVGDDAFPLKTSLMKPYPQRGLTDRERIFNYRLSRARRVSENAFGILVNRFRVLYHTMIVNPDSATDIIESCLALHNFLRTERDVRYNQIHTNTQQSTATERPVLFRGNNNAEQARAVRDELREYFWADGQVPFQWSMIK